MFAIWKNLSDRYEKKLLDTTIKTGLDTRKTTSKKVVHKVATEAGEFMGKILLI